VARDPAVEISVIVFYDFGMSSEVAIHGLSPLSLLLAVRRTPVFKSMESVFRIREALLDVMEAWN
jgi:hypothetical protein